MSVSYLVQIPLLAPFTSFVPSSPLVEIQTEVLSFKLKRTSYVSHLVETPNHVVLYVCGMLYLGHIFCYTLDTELRIPSTPNSLFILINKIQCVSYRMNFLKTFILSVVDKVPHVQDKNFRLALSKTLCVRQREVSKRVISILNINAQFNFHQIIFQYIKHLRIR